MPENTSNVFIDSIELDPRVVDVEMRKLANYVADRQANAFKLALIRVGAIATAKTLQSVKPQFVLDSPSRGLYIRNVVARRAWQNIQDGRQAGKKMPPLEAMIEWFQAMGIPKSAWFPIRMAIARRGIKPRDIQGVALKESARPTAEAVDIAIRAILKRGIVIQPRGANA